MAALSAIASVVSLLDVGVRSANSLRQLLLDFRNAPIEVEALYAEVGDYAAVIIELEETCQNFGATSLPIIQPRFATTLQQQIDRNTVNLQAVEKLVKKVRKENTTGPANVKTGPWVLRKKVAGELKGRLQDAKINLQMLLGVIVISTGNRVEHSINILQSSNVEQHRIILARLDQIQAQYIVTMEQVLQPALTKLHHELSLKNSFGSNVSLAETRRSPEEQCSVRSSGSNTERQSVTDSEIRDTKSSSVTKVSLHSSFTTLSTHASTGGLYKDRGDYLTEYHSQTVHSSCRHGKRFGSLFLIYVGPALWILIMNIMTKIVRKGHLRASLPFIELIYYFPPWLTTFALCMTLGMSQAGTPTFGLALRKRINESESFGEFTKAISGDPNEICSLFIDKKIHPNDVSGAQGFTLLHLAVANYRFDTISILLAAGADIHQKNDIGVSPYNYAQMLIHTRRGTEVQRKTLQSLFPSLSQQGMFKPSRLHEFMVDDQPGSLETKLRQRDYRLEINNLDCAGVSPLSWAVVVGNSDAVQALLQYGANLELCNKDGIPPLHFATVTSFACAHHLITAGADINRPVGVLGTTPLQFCAAFAHIQGVSSDRGAGAGASPMVYTGTTEKCRIGRLLLDKGADINQIDRFGESVLNTAIKSQAADFVRLLIERKVNYNNLNLVNHTILHQAAFYGDSETLKVLLAANLRGIDPNAADLYGRTAMDLLHRRPILPDGFLLNFELLLNQLQNTWEGDVFEEAAERQGYEGAL